MGMLKLCCELNLSSESVSIDSRCHILGKNLDDHTPIQSSLVCEKDSAHSSTSELALDRVGTRQLPIESFAKVWHDRGKCIAGYGAGSGQLFRLAKGSGPTLRRRLSAVESREHRPKYAIDFLQFIFGNYHTRCGDVVIHLLRTARAHNR